MKKYFRKLAAFIAVFMIGTAVFAGDCDLPDVDDKYIGTYIPVDIEEEIKKTKDIYGSLYKLGYPKHHDFLFLGKNICYSDVHFEDGYAIKLNDFLNYRFEITSEGTFIYDEKGFKYRQISNFVNEYGYGYEEFTAYVYDLIYKNVYSLKNVKIAKDYVVLDGVSYSIVFNVNFFEKTNVQYWLWSDSTGYCALVRNGLNGELHEGVCREDVRWWYPEEEVKAVYPLMFLDSSDLLPFYDNLPKDQYRLLRNMVYARHGYRFNSADLKAVFNQFTWYEINPEFSESMLSAEEKEYVARLLRKEKEL